MIDDLGSKAMIAIFGGKCIDSLASLRYNIFIKKIASAKSFVTPERLPPTASSTKFHCLRTYYQIMVWTEREGDIDVMNWGWKLEDNNLVPIMSEMNAAPDNLIKMIHCNRTTACKTPCCSCVGYGLPCHAVCGLCQLESYDNPYNQAIEEGEQK
jgi:hypothetical protein